MGTTLKLQHDKNVRLEHELELSENRNEVYEYELSGKGDSISVLQHTVESLEKSKDSVTKKLVKTANELGIKTKDLKSATALNISLTDSLKLKIKTGPTINNPNPTTCDFYADTIYNEYTKISAERIHGDLFIVPDISDQIDIYYANKTNYKEPKWYKRLFLFRWGKKTKTIHQLHQENEEFIKLKGVRFIEIDNK